MKTDITIALVSIAIAVCSLLGTIIIYWITKSREDYQNLHERISLYFGPEMHLAIKQLWSHYRENGEDKFVDKYIEIMQNDNQRLAECEPKDQVEFQRSTLHYQRRLVYSFWRGLAILMIHKLVPTKAVYNFWNQDDIEIIGKVLIPIEDKLAEYLGTGKLNPETEPLYILLKKKGKFYK